MDADAQSLSDKFEWDIYDIVIIPSNSNRAEPVECLLKNANHEEEVNCFIDRWDGRNIQGSEIRCEKEEDEQELCNKFQFGKCQMNVDKCHWEHVTCTAPDACPSTCRYGHEAGVKLPNAQANRKKQHCSLIVLVDGLL